MLVKLFLIFSIYLFCVVIGIALFSFMIDPSNITIIKRKKKRGPKDSD